MCDLGEYPTKSVEESDVSAVQGQGVCSVPVWVGQVPSGVCGEPAYGPRPSCPEWWNAYTGELQRKDGRYNGYVPGLACKDHGGPVEPKESDVKTKEVANPKGPAVCRCPCTCGHAHGKASGGTCAWCVAAKAQSLPPNTTKPKEMTREEICEALGLQDEQEFEAQARARNEKELPGLLGPTHAAQSMDRGTGRTMRLRVSALVAMSRGRHVMWRSNTPDILRWDAKYLQELAFRIGLDPELVVRGNGSTRGLDVDVFVDITISEPPKTKLAPPNPGFFFVVFDNPPGPTSGRFIEVEDAEGRGVGVGEWVEREDGYWTLGPFQEPSGILERAKELVNEQAEDEGLWFTTTSITEAYLQGQLRALHAVIESKGPEAAVDELSEAPSATSDGFECKHIPTMSVMTAAFALVTVGSARICGQCAAKLRAEGFQKGYAAALSERVPTED